MKNIISIISMVVILLVGCSEDFLEISPESTANVTMLYKTEKDFNDAVIGCYDGLQSRYGGFWQYDLASEDAIHQWPSEGLTLRMDKLTWQDNESYFQDSWSGYYEIIFRANTILSKFEEIQDDASFGNKDQLIGETKFLRALAYFDLVRIFGALPLVDRVITAEEALLIPREDVDKIYTLIISDLLDAENKLPEEYSQTDVGRATKGAAKAILGRVYLTHKDFTNAETKLEEVTNMGYALLTDYNDLWDYSFEHHSEYIFDIEFEEGVNEGSNFTNDFMPEEHWVREYYNVAGGASNTYTPAFELFDIWEEGDLRKDVTCANGVTIDGVFVPLEGSVGAKTFQKKYITEIKQGQGCKANWKVIRYGDVLLMLAEALNENNKTDESLIYLNMIRNRGGLESLSGLSQSEIREKIYLERRFELSFEGLRWFDLVRTGRAMEALGPLGLQPYQVLFPVPLSQIEIVNNRDIFDQNPGYE